MPWYAYLLIALNFVLAAIFFICWIRVRGSSSLSPGEVRDIEAQEKKRLSDLLEIEREQNKRLTELAKKKTEQLDALKVAFEEKKESINDESREYFQKLLDSPDAAADDLNNLIGISPRE